MKNRFLLSAAVLLVLGFSACKGSKDAGYSVRYTDHGATAPSPGQEPKYDTPSEGNDSSSPDSDGDGVD
jgi:hypothetical protein